jgi:hypothetical protein
MPWGSSQVDSKSSRHHISTSRCYRRRYADPTLADRLTERAARAADRKAIKDAGEAEKKAETKSCETELAQQFIVAGQPTALVAELNNSAEQAAALNSARRGRQANGPGARVGPEEVPAVSVLLR